MHQDLLIKGIDSSINFLVKTRFPKIGMEEANNKGKEIDENDKDIKFKRGWKYTKKILG